MARTLLSIRTDVRSIIGQTDSANSNFTDANIDIWINEGYRDGNTRLETATTTETKYTTAVTVTLNSAVQSNDTVMFQVSDGSTTKFKQLEVIDISDLARMDPDWVNTSTGEPTHAVKFGQFTMRLYPAPDSNNDAQAEGLIIYGNSLPTELVEDSDTTAWAHHLDDLLSHYAAYRAFSRLNNSERSISELKLYRGMLRDYKKMATDWSRRRRRFKFTETDSGRNRGPWID